MAEKSETTASRPNRRVRGPDPRPTPPQPKLTQIVAAYGRQFRGTGRHLQVSAGPIEGEGKTERLG